MDAAPPSIWLMSTQFDFNNSLLRLEKSPPEVGRACEIRSRIFNERAGIRFAFYNSTPEHCQQTNNNHLLPPLLCVGAPPKLSPL